MATLHRFPSGDDDRAFRHEVGAALAEGWTLHGGPTYAFDAARGVMRCGQAVTKEIAGPYRPGMALRDA